MPEGSSEDAWRAATPGTYIKNFPPTVLFHGLADVTVPAESSMEFLKMLRDANIPSELHTFAGVPHEFVGIPEFAESTSHLADFFLERHVINPKTYPAFGAGRGRGGEPGRGGEGRGGLRREGAKDAKNMRRCSSCSSRPSRLTNLVRAGTV
jgi:hypothetical protein